MRVVAGEFKGRNLEPVPGEATRPTADRVREAVASSVFSLRDGGFEGVSMLDAFAGSGAMGIEGLSRGAARCVFVESDPVAARTIEGNLAQLGLPAGRSHLVRGDMFSLAAGGLPGSPFDVVFLDPPYEMGWERVCSLVSDLDFAGAIADGALVAYERASGRARRKKGGGRDKKKMPAEVEAMLESLGEGFELAGFRTYGVTQVVYFIRTSR